MYRKLSQQEIAQLEAQGCAAHDWNEVEVAENFDARYVRNTNFSGHNRLGVFSREIELPGGLMIHSGIYSVVRLSCRVD